MTARRILAHLGHAVRGFLEASRIAGTGAPVASREALRAAHAACEHLVDAAHLISPSAGVRVAEAARRAFDDAHRRVAAREADLHADGLDESGAASCAVEGTHGHVVDVGARAADHDGLTHGGQGSAGRIDGATPTPDTLFLSTLNRLRECLDTDRWDEAVRIVLEHRELLDLDEAHWLLSLMPPSISGELCDQDRAERFASTIGDPL